MASFCYFLSVSCAESQNENEDSTESSDSSEIANEETDATADSDTTPVDPNAWHEDCPIEQFEYRMMDVGEVKLNVACREAVRPWFSHGFPEFHYSWKPVMDGWPPSTAWWRRINGDSVSDKPEAIEAYELPRLTLSSIYCLMGARRWFWWAMVGAARWLGVAHTEGLTFVGTSRPMVHTPSVQLFDRVRRGTTDSFLLHELFQKSRVRKYVDRGLLGRCLLRFFER